MKLYWLIFEQLCYNETLNVGCRFYFLSELMASQIWTPLFHLKNQNNVSPINQDCD